MIETEFSVGGAINGNLEKFGAPKVEVIDWDAVVDPFATLANAIGKAVVLRHKQVATLHCSLGGGEDLPQS